MAVRIGSCVAFLFFGAALADRLPAQDLTEDSTELLQLHSDVHSVGHEPASAVPEAAAAAQTALDFGITPGQVAASIASAIIAGAGVSADKAQGLVESLDVEGLADDLAEVFGNRSLAGDLGGQVDLRVVFDAPEAMRIITDWLDKAARVFAEPGLADTALLRRALAKAARRPEGPGAEVEAAFLESPDADGPESTAVTVDNLAEVAAIMDSLFGDAGAEGGDALGPGVDGLAGVLGGLLTGALGGHSANVTVSSGEDGGQTEVVGSVDAASFLSNAERRLGDFAGALEAAGLADAFVRAGAPEVGRGLSLLERRQPSKHGIAQAMRMMAALLDQTLHPAHAQSR